LQRNYLASAVLIARPCWNSGDGRRRDRRCGL